MPEAGPTVVLPRRPLTVGELLDSAVLLLREQAVVLVPFGAVLAVAEQLLLAPLRVAAHVEPPVWWYAEGHLAAYWLLLAVGAATEGLIIALLGNPAARAARAALLGRSARAGELLRPAGARWPATLLLALVAGAVMFTAALCGPAWFVGFALLGAAIPALVVDGTSLPRVLPRAAALAARGGLRAGLVRLLGYVGWWILRVGLATGLIFGLSGLDLVPAGWAVPVAMVSWAAVNMVAYPALACLDAVLHLETRMRGEGLDILLARARPSTPDGVLLAADR
ncbi:hypothetical protein [Micromonospora costi]|uniref:Glycerophosphoryl diester phosphodiesterase membrane domain-containing protein n=1 Tax=Micromonospora costi TaxID=1530042 RepID=A0A3B0ACW1_9ACTN|nr:hypothetical protein [Micromonospora costi]RKN58263.1 hypothetical protein D7193_06700 [Micromonospora costi]